MVSGGSAASTSLIWAATTVTTQTTPAGSAGFGVSVKLLAGVVKVMFEPAGHSIRKEPAFAFTCSLKLIWIVALAATPVAPLLGVVLVTCGAASVLNRIVRLAGIASGGSALSASVTLAATTVSRQLAPCGMPPVGVRVKTVAGEADRLNGIAVAAGHS